MNITANIARQKTPLVRESLLCEESLLTFLNRVKSAPKGIPQRLWFESLFGPVKEFLQRRGGRFRSQLVAMTWRLSGRDDLPPAALPWIVELLHAGSLIIDDIEDGSIQRRGKATLHRIIGTPAAINTGNWLYFWPLTWLSELGFSNEIELSLHRLCMESIRTCHEGQAIDLVARIGDLQANEVCRVVQTISEYKTGGQYNLGDEIDEATMKQLKKLGYTFEKI